MEQKSSSWNLAKHQRLWYSKWHTWAGITAGFVLIIVSLTGALLVFEAELDEWLYSELYDFEKTGNKLSYQEVTEKVKNDYPELDLGGVFLRKETDVYTFFSKKKPFYQIIANPYTGNVTGKRVYKKTVMGFIRNLHRTLLIPGIGRYIVGISSLVCVVLIVTGLKLWIPDKWNKLKHKLTLKWSSNKKRFNYDFHYILGAYFSSFITIIASTGVMITFSSIVLIFMFLLNFQSPKSLKSIFNQKSEYIVGKKPISIDSLIAIVEREIPETSVTGIRFPSDSLGTYTVNTLSPYSTQTGDVSFIFVDQYSGKFIFNSHKKELQLGKLYLNWVTPFHYGTFGGLPTRIIALIAALATATLFISGFIIWIPRIRKRNKKKKNITY